MSLASNETPNLRRSFANSRSFFSGFCTAVTLLLVLIATVPLFSVLYMLSTRGGETLSWDLFTKTAPTIFNTNGGIGNAIVGTLVMVALATVVSWPIGILGAIYIAEVAPQSRLSNAVRFSAKLLTGLPSIIAGVFVFGVVVSSSQTFSAVAGGLALGLLMIPVILLTAEEALKMVPPKMREAAYGMGCTRTQVITRVIVPTALPGILTGTMLAIARAAGETAPLLFTAQYASQRWFYEDGRFRLWEKTQSLAVFIYENYGSFVEEISKMAWGAAFVLVTIVLFFNIVGQLISWRTSQQHR